MAIQTNIILTPCCEELSEIRLSIISSFNILVGSGYRDLATDYCYTTEIFEGSIEGQGFQEISFEDFESGYVSLRDDCETEECIPCEEPPEPIPCCLEGDDFTLCISLLLSFEAIGGFDLNDVYQKSETLYNGEYFYTYFLTTKVKLSLSEDVYFFVVFDGVQWIHYVSTTPFDGLNIPVDSVNINTSNNLVNNNWNQSEGPFISIFSTTCCKKHFLIENCLDSNITFILQTPLDFNYPIGQVLSFNLINSNITGVNCWKIISELETVLPEDNIVCLEVLDCYNSCKTCIPECICTKAVNNSESARKLEYIDCDGQLQETEETINSGKSSKKYCVLEWVSDEIEIVSFGNCKDNECPETPRPKKFIAPGYNTPICSPENYERIVCRYSENKYKEVMNKRYGIENCCPDDSIQNDIKYELIHLQILKDPNYECVSNNNPCGCNGGSPNLSSHNCNS